jgi:carboxyl-terminal processing protease
MLVCAPGPAFGKRVPGVKPAGAGRASEVAWPKVAMAAASLLENQHYLRPPLDGAFSKRVLERYFEVLDPDRLYFLKPDLEDFRARFGEGFAAGLKSGQLERVDEMHERYAARVHAFCRFAEGAAGGDWEFTEPWTSEISRERSEWPADESEALAVWTAQVGAELLQYRLEGMSQEKAAEQVRKRVYNLEKFSRAEGTKERVAVALLALARSCDAHSDYLTQEELEDTENELRLTRIGIGVTLDIDPVGLRIVGLMPGGPAQKDGRLRVNDRIVGVAEERGPFRELDGVPMAQALGYLRGGRGTLVRLKIAPARASDPAQRLEVGIRRDEMRSREGEAYAKIIECPAGEGETARRFGWLVVPGFYGDDTAPVGRRGSSVSKDVAVLLKRLMVEKVDGVVLDFRGNLGGLLDEAVEVGGLFCGKAPIAVVRTPDAELEVLSPARLRNAKALYAGPLVVVTDRGSASASELVAGALQDYGRAVVVGGEQTFGKGSVQTTVPLGEYLSGLARLPVGGLAVTVGKFYRVNGQSTQIVGVRPDIVLPSTLDLPFEGEAALKDALPHDSIPALAPPMSEGVSLHVLEELRGLSAKRVAASPAFAAVAAERDQVRKERRENRLSLEEKTRREALESAHRDYSAREAGLEKERMGQRFCRLLLEDVKAKRLRLSEADALASRDPESVAVEGEVLRILADMAEVIRRAGP